MKSLYFFTLLFVGTTLMAQDVRYLNEVFPEVEVIQDVPYATNLSIFPGVPTEETLFMDVYLPADDAAANRPVMLFIHGGSFIPKYFNNQPYGSNKDSTVVEICTRLARMGYVAVAPTYRLGWNPLSPSQDVRTGTLLAAAYRGIHDMKACVRYLRRSVDEMGNPYGITPEKIGVWGMETGGFIAYGAYLDTISEIQIPKFKHQLANQYYINEEVNGNVDGTDSTQFNRPNHPKYSSAVQLVINMEGAIPDIGWINGDPAKEPPTIGFHPITSPFAPYVDGPMILSATGQFLANVTGPRVVVAKANDTGLNAVFEMANAEDNILNLRMDMYKTTRLNDSMMLTVDNCYPFLFDSPQVGPWQWWDLEAMRLEIELLNMSPFVNLNPDLINLGALTVNPDMSKEKAMRYIDTLMMYVTPRAFYAFNLATGTDQLLDPHEHWVDCYPNPAGEHVVFNVDPKSPIREIALYDLNGRLVKAVLGINTEQFQFNRNQIRPGMYVARLRFKEGFISKTVVFR